MSIAESNKRHEEFLNYNYINTLKVELKKIGFDTKKLNSFNKYEDLFEFIWKKYNLRHEITQDSQSNNCKWVSVYKGNMSIFTDWRFYDEKYCENLALYVMLKNINL